MGRGQLRPRTSRSLSKFVIVARLQSKVKTIYQTDSVMKPGASTRSYAPKRDVLQSPGCLNRPRHLNWDAFGMHSAGSRFGQGKGITTTRLEVAGVRRQFFNGRSREPDARVAHARIPG